MPSYTRTVCLEFFGNARDAVPSIVEIKDFMFGEQKCTGTLLAGLEHLDDRYLKAVGYATKSKRGGLPKMVLFGDIAGDDADAVARATSEVVRIANSRAGEGFIAVSPEARKKFWLDRKRTAIPFAPISNTTKMTTFTASSGLFAGSFTINGTTTALNRPAPFYGQLVKIGATTQGYGYFLLPTATPKISTSSKLSGRVVLGVP